MQRLCSLQALTALTVVLVATFTTSLTAGTAGFPDSFPSEYTPGSDGPLAFDVPGGLGEYDDVLALAWSDSENRMMRDFAHAITGEPWQISAERMQTLPAGRVQLQLMTRDNGGIVTVARQWIQVNGETRIAFAEDAPDERVQGSDAGIGVQIKGAMPDDADVLALAWSDARQRMVTAFAHVLGQDATELSPDRLNELPLGRVQLQLLYREGGAIASRTTSTASIRAPPFPLRSRACPPMVMS